MVLSRDHVVQKRWSCEVVGSDQFSVFPGWFRFVSGTLCFWIVDLTFHEQWHRFGVLCQPSCSGSFAWLGSHPSLLARMPLLKYTGNMPQVFFQVVFVIWPIWAHISTSKGRFLRIRPLIFPARPSQMLPLDEDKGWCFDKMEVDDMLMQDNKTIFVQESTSQVS